MGNEGQGLVPYGWKCRPVVHIGTKGQAESLNVAASRYFNLPFKLILTFCLIKERCSQKRRKGWITLLYTWPCRSQLNFTLRFMPCWSGNRTICFGIRPYVDGLSVSVGLLVGCRGVSGWLIATLWSWLWFSLPVAWLQEISSCSSSIFTLSVLNGFTLSFVAGFLYSGSFICSFIERPSFFCHGGSWYLYQERRSGLVEQWWQLSLVYWLLW